MFLFVQSSWLRVQRYNKKNNPPNFWQIIFFLSELFYRVPPLRFEFKFLVITSDEDVSETLFGDMSDKFHILQCLYLLVVAPPSPYPSQYVCSIRVLEKARFRKTMRPALYRNRSPLMRWERAAVRLVSCCTNPRSEWIYIYRHIFGKPLS